MTGDPTMQVCPRCKREFEQRTGRGGKSVFCDDCKAERRRDQSLMRTYRFGLSAMGELVEVVLPIVLKWKARITEVQEGRCAKCGKARKLYLAANAEDEMYGLCLVDHEEWVRERRRNA